MIFKKICFEKGHQISKFFFWSNKLLDSEIFLQLDNYSEVV